MSLILRCVVCDDKIPNQYSGGPACGGSYCLRFEATKPDRLTVTQPDPMKRRAA